MTTDTIDKPGVGAPSINLVLQVAERFGVRRQQLLSALHLQPDWLSNPDDRLPVARLFDAYRVAAELSGEPDLGLYVGRAGYFGGLNLLLYMSTICQDFRDYLNLVPSIHKLRGDIGSVVIEREGQFLRLEWQPLQQESKAERFLSDDILGSSQAIVNTLCIDPIRVRRAHFTYSRPADVSELEATFGAELHFDQAVSCLYFDRSVLSAPVIKLDYELHENFTTGLKDLFERDQNADPFLLSARRTVARALPTGDVSIDNLATELGVSRRTLQRRLTQRNTHFLQVLADVRAEMASNYLVDKRLGVTEIAFLLGYSDQASFSTAFKGWYGVSPSEFRGRG
jgi:AraC-like DNA-binding protein